MFGELKVYLNSVQKWIIVHQTVQSRFSQLTVRPITSGLTWGSADLKFPSCTASRTQQHTPHMSCGCMTHRSSSQWRHRSVGRVWSHLQQMGHKLLSTKSKHMHPDWQFYSGTSKRYLNTELLGSSMCAFGLGKQWQSRSQAVLH